MEALVEALVEDCLLAFSAGLVAARAAIPAAVAVATDYCVADAAAARTAAIPAAAATEY